MSRLSLTILITIALLAPAFAGFKVPKNVYRIKDLEKASEIAAKKKKGVAIIYANTKTTYPLCEAATKHSMATFSKIAIAVYVDTTEYQQFPESIRVGFQS